jgi:hypothetical protein
MFEIHSSDENQRPSSIEPLATASTYAEARELAVAHAAGRMYGTVIVLPTGVILRGDDTEAEVLSALRWVEVAKGGAA